MAKEYGKEFFEKLKDFYDKHKDNGTMIIKDSDGGMYIHPSWLYTNIIDREILLRAVSKLLKCDYSDIEEFRIVPYREDGVDLGVNLEVKSRDKYVKIINGKTKEPYLFSFYSLAKEIERTRNSVKINEMIKTFGLKNNNTTINELKNCFFSKENFEFDMVAIEQGLSRMIDNISGNDEKEGYYDYLLSLGKNFDGDVILPNEDPKENRKPRIKPIKPRNKSIVYRLSDEQRNKIYTEKGDCKATITTKLKRCK